MALFQEIGLLHPAVTPTEIHAAFSEVERMSRDVNTITLLHDEAVAPICADLLNEKLTLGRVRPPGSPPTAPLKQRKTSSPISKAMKRKPGNATSRPL
jgi:hypothetical protein